MAKAKETFNKKEREKKKQKIKEMKLERKHEKKTQGKQTLEDMMAYVDENGNLSSTPPDPYKKKTFNLEDINTGVPVRTEEDPEREGTIDFFNEAKGYGFIKDAKTRQSIFVHSSQTSGFLQEHDKVSYQVERTPKGLSAIQVKKIN